MSIEPIAFALRGEFIALDALLKASGLASSGGMAKQMIVAGLVRVDDSVEIRRSCKIRAGQIVECGDAILHVETASD